ncbi:MAG: 2-amino-4-hydroxy-6-hydroxymethyldihydropteridine diphosphokinase [Methylococcales bacterium]|jgi:2-amino-4-hydroxy-6-hydroxymethyldihydropteridine diphosphokinase|nr:2-amino-4-hydroxy-6-hydroxymethyldihydropteridine diphosphokinase [Methylococcales bacterium]MBT3699474.1 2-amino-4-hydroxy-6-hydroxymethyldihydropteridine diphosphokinase [Methylococcales bacterium]MBT4032238.1 2-amino-4-hydroxy-6-hydroxymethyldihydropteridine diphosphokinase [Methylococcales bacterium]MBT4347347.1 2-amino-4-hydroxy-6-hydroxymethyldihydropteridine diphosphokinase [Methylococcales bacterium]MBT4598982.1 2-amino-4-hydroxy-6-hydroxymethyldihydropteridine diphosphokinase [Methy
MPIGHISIGSNIKKEKNIPSCLIALEKELGTLKTSSTYETEPVGFTGANFFNLIAVFNSELPVKTIGKTLKRIEKEHGRVHGGNKFEARTLDLDLILYGNLILSEGRLQIPRNEITRYAFVLEPLAEISPNLRHPETNIEYAELWENFDKSDLKQHKIDTPS